MRWVRWLLQPNPRRFLAVWYTLWLGYALKGFFLNWFLRRQPIRIAWVPVTGWVEGLYLFGELAIVGHIAWQAWRFERADWRLAFLYEWYSLVEIGLSALHPSLWTYAMTQMWHRPAVGWSQGWPVLASHLGFIAFYAFIHHGLPLLVLRQLALQGKPSVAAAV